MALTQLEEIKLVMGTMIREQYQTYVKRNPPEIMTVSVEEGEITANIKIIRPIHVEIKERETTGARERDMRSTNVAGARTNEHGNDDHTQSQVRPNVRKPDAIRGLFFRRLCRQLGRVPTLYIKAHPGTVTVPLAHLMELLTQG